MKVINSEAALEQQRKRFMTDSKKAIKNFIGMQKRSRMLVIEKEKSAATLSSKSPQVDRYLIELV